MNFINWPFLLGNIRIWGLKSGVAPANQTEESEIRELPEKVSGTGSRTPLLLGKY